MGAVMGVYVSEKYRLMQGELMLMARRLRGAQQGLRDYLGALTQGQEEERRRLARELHDDTIQSLIALNQRLQLARTAANPPSAEQLAGMEQLATDTIADLRALTRDLRPKWPPNANSPTRPASKPTPSSLTVSVARPAAKSRVTAARLARAWRPALRSAS